MRNCELKKGEKIERERERERDLKGSGMGSLEWTAFCW